MASAQTQAAALYSSKKPYGNKTVRAFKSFPAPLYSSKKPYGNKTLDRVQLAPSGLYSSKKPYGNKTGSYNISSQS